MYTWGKGEGSDKAVLYVGDKKRQMKSSFEIRDKIKACMVPTPLAE